MTRLEGLVREIRSAAAGLLHSRHLELFIGYRKAGFPLRTRPVFLTRAEGAGKLVWSSFCSVNLAVYLPRLGPGEALPGFVPGAGSRVGIVAKPCDARSVATLVRDGQVAGERVFLVVASCPGVLDRRRVEAVLGGKEALGAGEDDGGDLRVVVEDGTEVRLARAALEAESCRACDDRAPGPADLAIDLPEGTTRTSSVPPALMMPRPPEGGSLGISRCIVCRACERMCPRCAARSAATGGAELSPATPEAYHDLRAQLIASGCTSCGACVRLCPVGIDPRSLQGPEHRPAEGA